MPVETIATQVPFPTSLAVTDDTSKPKSNDEASGESRPDKELETLVANMLGVRAVYLKLQHRRSKQQDEACPRCFRAAHRLYY